MTCPVCGHEQARWISTFHKPELGHNISYQLLKCISCGFGFIEGPLTPEILNQVYGEAFHLSSQQNAMILPNGQLSPEALHSPIVINAQQRVEMMRARNLSGRLLDVGAGKGFFVKIASSYFEAEGIELASSAVETGQAMGIKLRQGDFLQCEFPTEGYQVVTLWDVLASLPQPLEVIKRIHRILNPGGQLIMTLPDYDSFIARHTGKYWPLMIPPINLGYYTENSVKKLLHQNGFKLLSLEHQAKWVSIDFLGRKLLKTLGIKPPETLPVPKNWKCPINLGDIMTIFAEKRVEND